MSYSKREHKGWGGLSYWGLVYLEKKLKAIAYKGGKCIKCGYNKYYGALEFHHLDPESKEFDWPGVKNQAMATILAELDKCELLCSNCHKETHRVIGTEDIVAEWRANLNAIRVPHINCQTCNKSFKAAYNGAIYCGSKCRQIASVKIVWPPATELVARLETSTWEGLARELGVTSHAIKKHLKVNGIKLPPRIQTIKSKGD